MRSACILIFLLFPLPATAIQTGTPAPSFVLNDVAGASVGSSDYQGKVLLVTFWSPWCTPCRDELPALDRLYVAHKKDGFEVVAVSVEPSKEAVSAFLRKTGLSFPVLFDDKHVSDAYSCSHLPTTVFLDRNGVVRKITKGYGKESLHEYQQIIVEMIKQK